VLVVPIGGTPKNVYVIQIEWTPAYQVAAARFALTVQT
jgi:hypothetical protein